MKVHRLRKAAEAAVLEAIEDMKSGEYGSQPKQKEDGVIRMMYENWNSLSL